MSLIRGLTRVSSVVEEGIVIPRKHKKHKFE